MSYYGQPPLLLDPPPPFRYNEGETDSDEEAYDLYQEYLKEDFKIGKQVIQVVRKHQTRNYNHPEDVPLDSPELFRDKWLYNDLKNFEALGEVELSDEQGSAFEKWDELIDSNPAKWQKFYKRSWPLFRAMDEIVRDAELCKRMKENPPVGLWKDPKYRLDLMMVLCIQGQQVQSIREERDILRKIKDRKDVGRNDRWYVALCDDKTWDKIIKRQPRAAKFRNEPWLIYDVLDEVVWNSDNFYLSFGVSPWRGDEDPLTDADDSDNDDEERARPRAAPAPAATADDEDDFDDEEEEWQDEINYEEEFYGPETESEDEQWEAALAAKKKKKAAAKAAEKEREREAAAAIDAARGAAAGTAGQEKDAGSETARVEPATAAAEPGAPAPERAAPAPESAAPAAQTSTAAPAPAASSENIAPSSGPAKQIAAGEKRGPEAGTSADEPPQARPRLSELSGNV
ncbi:hypothetical protein IAT38_008112 [Cryptococcus sp. DSM 104549]